MRQGSIDFIHVLEKFFKEKYSGFGLKFAFLYGSRAIGMAKDNSDIDIAILFEDSSLNEAELFDRVMDISYSLSGLMGIDVDIIVIDMDFSRPMLFYNAIVLGIPLLITNESEYIKLREEAIYHMEDFKLFGLQWQRMLIEKNLGALKHAGI